MSLEIECRAEALYTGDDRLVRVTGLVKGLSASRVEIVTHGESDEPEPTLHVRLVGEGVGDEDQPLQFSAVFSPRRWVRVVRVDQGPTITVED
jgi:hypothetical protein